MTELDVALSDFAMALESLAFLAILVRTKTADPAPRNWFAALFLGLACSAAFGGIWHGFFAEPGSVGGAILWPAAMLAIGLTTWCSWNFGAALILPPKGRRWVGILAGIGFAVYCAVVLLVSRDFLVAIANYLPSALFLLAAFAIVSVRLRSWDAAQGVLGLLLIFVAAGIQQTGITLHPVYLTHNTLYHLVQMAGLLFVFLGGRRLLSRKAPAGKPMAAE